MDVLRKTAAYARYLTRAKGKHGIHSPFVFQLLTDVLRNKADAPTKEIERIRFELLQDNTPVLGTDLGAGSQSGNNRTVGQVVRSSATPRKHCNTLYQLAKHLRPATMLELGTNAGISGAYLAMGGSTGKLITVEGNETLHKVATGTFNRLQLNNVEQILGNFDDVLPGILENNDQIDIAFLDGNHREEPTLKYYNQLAPKMAGGLMILDDIYWSGGMARAWKQIIDQPQATVTIDLFHFGLVFFRTDQAKEHFTLRI